jgi:4,5-dihydroxyphthalate decarboxylase
MADIKLTLAINDYDHVRDLAHGRVKADGIELTHLQLGVEEIFLRFSQNLEWEVSEMSFGMYTSAVSRGDAPFTGIPVFPSRVFRHSAIFVRADGKVKRAEDLADKRIGVPQWSQTATIYVRGWLTDTVGVPLRAVHWFQAGVNQAGRIDPARVRIPDGVRYTPVADKSLTDMLLAGEIDAIFTAHPPHAFEEGHPNVVRLFPDYQPVEEAYFAATGIYPIMHTVAIRRDAFDRNPWIARSLYKAFDEAKRRSAARLADITASQIALPWGYAYAERMAKRLFPGADYWPYGIAANRTTIEAFLKFCFDQGVAARHLRPEELYPKEALTEFRV